MQRIKQTKEQRFRRLAEQRVNVILDKLRLLGQLSNRSNYEYTDAQIEAMFRAIQRDLNSAKAKFREGSRDRNRFTFEMSSDDGSNENIVR